MSSQNANPIVSTSWLNTELNEKKNDLAVIDATWFPDKDASEDFAKEHISTATYMDMFKGVENTPLYPRNIPDAATFQTNARGSAVNNSDHVIVYEDIFGNFMAGRAWWMFKLFGHENVSVMDGGLAKWKGDGFETTTALAKKKEGDLTAKFNPKWIVKFEEMVENLTSRKAQVCDSRGPAMYNKKPDDQNSGHYPGAVNIPYPSLFNSETKALKTVDELKKVYSDAGIDLSKPVIGMCIGGMSSCTLVLTAHLCGCPDVALYHGGFMEWKGRADPSQIE
ncbi:unnamed protein product [Porites lobata]|uniref:Rhodanese domain-containing protein n=1 Tax=Porites lobata TaxID=104759 RepID=A0ABN8PK52_9CNID|nr:unnamed protein product [Porites lobata]